MAYKTENLPSREIKAIELADDKLSLKGDYLVVELTADHDQLSLPVIPKGTRAIVIGGKTEDGERLLAVTIPYDALPKDVEKIERIALWKQGTVRIIPRKNTKTLGRASFPKKLKK